MVTVISAWFITSLSPPLPALDSGCSLSFLDHVLAQAPVDVSIQPLVVCLQRSSAYRTNVHHCIAIGMWVMTRVNYLRV